MEYRFTDLDFDKKLLLSNEVSGINRFLLENNTKQVNAIYDFLSGQSKLLLINGFLGTGKTSVLEHTLNYISDDALILNYNCFETTILDDILLSFFDDFKKFSALGKINILKVKSENFTQKINYYFQSVTKPVVVVINSFEEVLKSNKPEIFAFIKHLCKMSNVKVVMIATAFDLTEVDIPYEKVTILALEKSIFEKYLKSEDMKQIGAISDELYKQTRGYFLYTTLSLKIMKLRQLSLIDFIDGFSRSFLTFNDFILREALSLVDPVSGHLLRFLTVIRHPVSVKLLKSLHLWDEDKALFFINNLILSKQGENIYLQNYYKTIAENSIPANVSVKLHQGCVDLYNTQLPLKPLERDLLISRQTMRNEIEYHSTFIPKKLQRLNTVEEKPVIDKQPVNSEEIKAEVIHTKEEKDEKIKNMSFIFEDDEYGVLDKIADSIKDFLSFSDKRSEQEKADNKLTLSGLMTQAQSEEHNFNYSRAITLYTRALTQKNDDDYYTFLPVIYTKLAFNYQNLSKWYDSQKYFEMALEFYKSTGDSERINEIKYNIANIFYETFKRDKAKEILNEIEKTEVSNELMVKVYNLLANLTSDNNIACEYYKKALALNPVNIDKAVLSELYYKFALLNEDDMQTALMYLKKTVELDSNPKKNPHLSDALSNIAQLYDDIGEGDAAIRYYLESIKFDEILDNSNGIYSSCMKLAEIYSSKNQEMAVEYYQKALKYAKELNESFFIIAAATALGDFYYNRNENKSAIDNYKIAYKYAKESFNKENLEKIRLRVEDIKIRLGEERFNQLEK